jgi:Zn-dependent protease with chaperone function
MDFFGAQTRARRNSRWLVLWFALAVLGMVAVVYLASTLIFGWTPVPGSKVSLAARYITSRPGERVLVLWDSSRFLWTLLVLGGSIAIASLYKTFQIARQGGAFVALKLGGRPVLRHTDDPLEKRLINVVDEMSIAAGIPAPQVFVLDNEPGLNAFAAGITSNNSVIAVTRGLLDHLNRDQMQGVIGHEISHITNGDARLNLRLIGVLHGILFLPLAGRALLHIASSALDNIFSLFFALFAGLFGVLLVIIGYIGAFFGRLIQAAVSREREYLADASAVQFTRKPDGLASALRQLDSFGSRIRHPYAEAASHLFFGAGKKLPFFSRWFATHPPIPHRLARLQHISLPPATAPAKPVSTAPAPVAATIVAAAPVAATITDTIADLLEDCVSSDPTPLAHAQALIATLSPSLLAALTTPAGAQAAAYALLIAPQADIRQRQLDILRKTHSYELFSASDKHAQWLADHSPRVRLPLLDLALPVLRELSAAEIQTFLGCVDALIRADGRLSAVEFALQHILHAVLLPAPVRPALRLERLDNDVACLLAFLAYAGNHDAAAATAYRHARDLSPMSVPLALPALKTLRPETIDTALGNLAHASRHFRAKLLDACVAAVEHDGNITVAEAELLRAFAQSLDCPAPPVFPGATSTAEVPTP